MVTTTGKTIAARSVTRKSPKTTKFVSRRTIIREYNPASWDCKEEQKLLKQEFACLFAEFSADKRVVAVRRQTYRAGVEKRRLEAQQKRASQFKQIGAALYSAVTSVGAVSDGKTVILPAKASSPKPLLSRAEARRDYTRAYNQQRQERAAALALVKAMAARRPRIIRKRATFDPRIEREELRKKLRAARYAKRHPCVEVENFGSQEEFWARITAQKVIWAAKVQRWDSERLSATLKGSAPRARATSVKQVKTRSPYRYWSNEKAILRDYIPYPPVPPTELSEALKFLKFKIRGIIKSFRDPHYWDNLFNRCLHQEGVRPEMETEGVVQNVPDKVIQKSNFVIAESGDIDQGKPVSSSEGFRQYAVSKESQKFTTLVDRWIPIYSGKWTATDAIDKTIKSIKLPADAFVKASNPIFSILLSHRYFRCNIKVKVILNSSPWQTGQLVVDFLYKKDTQGIDTVFTAFQRNYAILNAGSSNDVILDIPYNHYNSYLTNYSAPILGTLNIRVLNKLEHTENVASQASFSVYLAFENIDAHGIISRVVGTSGVSNVQPQGEMESIGKLCNVGADVLYTAGRILDRDNPPLPLQPVSFVPQASTSFAYTDGVPEPVQVLRADCRGQRPSRFSDVVDPVVLAQKWGFLKTFNWSFDDTVGKELIKIDVEPVLPATEYQAGPTQEMTGGKNKLTTCYYPPLTVASSLFNYWRGNIKFRFDVVGNAFYTGTLQVSAIPMGTSTTTSNDLLSCSMTAMFDIRETSSFEFEVPWNWCNAWKQVRPNFNRTLNPMATLYVVVVNPLIGINLVPNAVRINMYVSAGKGYELAIMKSPYFALPGIYVQPASSITLKPYDIKASCFSSYIGGESSESTYVNYLVFDSGHTDWVGYLGGQVGQVFKFENLTSQGRYATLRSYLQNSKGEKDPSYISHGVLSPLSGSKGCHGLLLFGSHDAAKKFAMCLKDKQYDISKAIDLAKVRHPNYSFFWDKDGDRTYTKDANNVLVTLVEQEGEYLLWSPVTVSETLEDSFEELVVGEMQSEGVVITTERPTDSTSEGLLTYGERIPSLKGLGRRWQHLTSRAFKTCDEKYPRDCPPAIVLPVTPSRVNVVERSASYDNRVRDGVISLLSSAFAFWDGSIRYRFVVAGDVPKDAVLYVQHRFDRQVSFNKIKIDNKIKNRHDLMDTHYATAVQALTVNPILTIEVPYYSQYERLNCRVDDKKQKEYEVPFANGELLAWVHSSLPADFNMEIYYSLGDDFQYSVFQGFPAMVDLRQLDEYPEPQMDMEGETITGEGLKLKEKIKNRFRSKSKREVEEEIPPSPSTSFVSGVKAWGAVGHRVEPLVVAAEDAVEDLRKFTQTMQPVAESLNKLNAKLSKSRQDNAEAVGIEAEALKNAQFLKQEKGLAATGLEALGLHAFPYLTHVVYCMLNPNGKTVAWAVCNLYKELFGISLDGVGLLVSGIASVFDKVTHPKQQNRDEPRGEMDEDHVSSVCSVLFCSICTLVRMKVNPPTSWKGIADGLFAFSNSCRGARMVCQFIQDNITLFSRIWEKLLSYFKPANKDFKVIAGLQDERMKTWAVHVSAMLNPSIRETILSNPFYAEKIFELAVIGRALSLVIMGDNTVPSGISRFLNTNLKKLLDLESELVNRKMYCAVRYEPFCLWSGGENGTGKSRLNEKIALELQKMSGKSGAAYHTITSGQQYFDAFVGQPTILMDDFIAGNISTDPMVPLFLQMKSKALFNPPFSITTDKCRMVNFYNLLISSNQIDFTGKPTIADPGAYNRRRNVLLYWERSKDFLSEEEVKKKFGEDRDAIDAYYEDLKQANVYYFPNSSSGDSQDLQMSKKVLIPREEGKVYSKVVIDFVMERARAYHSLEEHSFAKACEERRKAMSETCDSASSLSDYLTKVEKLFKLDASTSEVDASSFRTGLTTWFSDHKSNHEERGFESLHKKMAPKPIPDDEPKEEEPLVAEPTPSTSTVIPEGLGIGHRWPHKECLKSSLCEGWEEDARVGIPIEPVRRHTLHDYHYNWKKPRNDPVCLHAAVTNYQAYMWTPEVGAFCAEEDMLPDTHLTPTSFPIGCCMTINENKELVPFKGCIMNTGLVKLKFYDNLWAGLCRSTPEVHSQMLDWEKKEDMVEAPWELIEYAMKREPPPLSLGKIKLDGITKKRFELLQKTYSDQFEPVGGSALPKKSLWKTIPATVWKYFLKVAKIMYKIINGAYEAITLIFKIALLSSVVVGAATTVRGFSNGYKSPKPELHPSGDYKTLKLAKSVRARAVQLSKPHNGNSTEFVCREDQIEQVLLSRNSNPKADGRLRKIVNNTFSLIGIVPVGEQQCRVFPSRCIGLYDRKFLVLRHYIEHFKNKGVKRVAVVFHEAKGLVQFDLDDIEFMWGQAGYGVGEFPSLPRLFSNIVKYMPTERCQMEYPREAIMVETTTEGIEFHYLDIDRLKKIQKVPSFDGQSAWDIELGFKYQWGGPGKCGSFLFIPEWSTPLIGVHTAGTGGRVGFSEILLRETFFLEDEDIPFEMVVPEMEIDDNKTLLPGEGYQVGNLPASKSVNIPNRSKIVPSEISGVFPIRTEPAPLSAADPRLDTPESPLLLGVEKRTLKPKEFPAEVLRTAYDDYLNQILAKVKPLRTVGTLTVAQAVEGLPLPGYEPIEMSTSEGYPWTLKRPASAKNKSWLFSFEEYPDGRKKLVGINAELQDMLNIKHKMRLQAVVPATYFTSCLKDARILKEKVSTPGKTRVFEMSPIDLTIAQRQYFLDFYAAFQASRVEHTIGINPDGYEWTELAENLISFSPHILTADYSAFGPRLLHSVLRYCNMVDVAWYEEQFEQQGLSEDQMSDEFLSRAVNCIEYSHPMQVVKDMVCMYNCGQQSGNCATVLKNSQVNSLYIRMAYIILARRHAPSYADCYWFKKFVLLYTNGDDLIASVKPEIISWFNNNSLIELFAEFDIKMTDALKSGKTRDYCSIEEATYLKRGFLKHPFREGQWLAPLEIASIEDTANWVWSCSNHREASLVNSEMCARLAYTRGPHYYSYIVNKLSRKWVKLGVAFEAPSWHSLDCHVWEGTEGPKFSF
nr:MAG: polyprotein [Planococcus ficus-associated iflavirus 1]